MAGNAVVWLVFVGVYLGMAIGRVPGLAIDRTGITLTGVAILLLAGALSIDHLAAPLELPTLLLLFALMLCRGLAQRGLDPRPYLLGLPVRPTPVLRPR